nr:HEPN domain-containing protein [Hymenobacter psoromatis]
MQAGVYIHGLFFTHLVIEKLSKAHWVKDNADDIPQRTHNIIKLWQATQLQPTPDQQGLAVELNKYQLEGRYPEYVRQLRTQTTAAYTTQLFTEITTLRTWLLSTLP